MKINKQRLKIQTKHESSMNSRWPDSLHFEALQRLHVVDGIDSEGKMQKQETKLFVCRSEENECGVHCTTVHVL